MLEATVVVITLRTMRTLSLIWPSMQPVPLPLPNTAHTIYSLPPPTNHLAGLVNQLVGQDHLLLSFPVLWLIKPLIISHGPPWSYPGFIWSSTNPRKNQERISRLTHAASPTLQRRTKQLTIYSPCLLFLLFVLSFIIGRFIFFVFFFCSFVYFLLFFFFFSLFRSFVGSSAFLHFFFLYRKHLTKNSLNHILAERWKKIVVFVIIIFNVDFFIPICEGFFYS